MKELEPQQQESKVVSLEWIRNIRNKKIGQEAKPPELRIQELEANVEKLVAFIIEQEERIDTLEDRCWRAIRLARQASSSAL